MAYEYNQIVYDTENEQLAKMLEAIRQRQKEANPFRIRIWWFGNQFKPYEGYIVHTEPKQAANEDTPTAIPLLAWKRNSSTGKKIDPSLISKIELTNKSLHKSIELGVLYRKDISYFDPIIAEWVNAAVFDK